ncbi:MAG: Sedolisin [Pedosphaera sp.]|nr:Sedolisin [Pedosphaera sp.]
MELAIGLPLRNKEALTDLLQQIYDPSSSQYHQYLSAEQFAEMFGPTEQQYQSVVDFMKSKGFVVTGTHPNRVVLDVKGSAADIEKTFHLALRVYNHPTEGRTFFAPDVEPSIDQDLPMLEVSGLDNYVLPHPVDLKRVAVDQQVRSFVTGSGPSGLFIGNDFRAAYAPGVTNTGSGQSIGLFEFGPYFPNDVTLYETAAHLSTSIVVTNVLLDGFSGIPSAGANDGEEALDIQMAISMAPGATIIVYEGSSALDIYTRMATDNKAKQLSCSFGFSPAPATMDQIFQQYAAQGQSMFQASGDSGANAGTVFFPLDDANITIVGGTSLTTTGAGGPWRSETAWSGSGGGVSTRYTIPTWQQGINMTTNHGSASQRNIPDVSMLADTIIYTVSKNGQAGGVGGTSAAAPLWAGFMALVNQQAVVNGKPTAGFINPAVYAIGKGGNYASCFHDIKSGSNTNSSNPTNFFAVAGYDLVTGWGTPAGQSLIAVLSGTLKPPVFATNPFSRATASTGRSYSGTIAGSATDPNGEALTYSKASGPAWLNIAANGVLSGTPANGDMGTNSFTVLVTDTGSQSAFGTLTIYVNGTPSFITDPFSEADVNVGQAYSATVATNAMDPDGDTFTFSKFSGPGWLNIAANGDLSGTPAIGDVGTNSFLVFLTDSAGVSVFGTMTIHVNGAPSFTSNPFTATNAQAGLAYSGSIQSNATDPNGDVLVFSKISGPGWLSVAGNGSLSGTPTIADAGTNTFVVSVIDPGGLSNNATMFVYVNGIVATSIDLGIAVQGNQVSLIWTGGNAPYQVQTATNLGSPVWQSLGGLISNNNLTITASNAAAFYRIQGQ